MITPVDRLPIDPMADFPNLRQQEFISDITDIITHKFPVCEITSIVPKTQTPRGVSIQDDLKYAIDAVVKTIQDTDHLKPFDGASAFDIQVLRPNPHEHAKMYITFDTEKWDQMVQDAKIETTE